MKDVLIIESKRYRGILSAALSEAGFVVDEHLSVLDSVDLLAHESYAVIIADATLLSALERFWDEKNALAAWVPIILSCDRAEIENTLFPVKQNAYEIVLKPYDIPAVRAMVTQARNFYLQKEQLKDIYPHVLFSARVRVPSTRQYMNALSAYLYELLMAHGFFREIRDIQLSCEEALMNACIHGNRDDATKHVTLAVTFAENVLSIEIGDEGPGFDYATALRNTKAHRGVFAASGRGIYMMSRHMDAISYKDNGATVILIKNRK